MHFITNATLNNIKHEIKWLQDVIAVYKGEAKAIFYYAGHGIPDEQNKSAYLLPIDGYGSDVTTGYALEDLYKALGSLPSKSVTVFLDACFSGAKRDGDMLASARGVAIKVKQATPVGNIVVFSAAQEMKLHTHTKKKNMDCSRTIYLKTSRNEGERYIRRT